MKRNISPRPIPNDMLFILQDHLDQFQIALDRGEFTRADKAFDTVRGYMSKIRNKVCTAEELAKKDDKPLSPLHPDNFINLRAEILKRRKKKKD
jgi:hypothetical protein